MPEILDGPSLPEMFNKIQGTFSGNGSIVLAEEWRGVASAGPLPAPGQDEAPKGPALPCTLHCHPLTRSASSCFQDPAVCPPAGITLDP